MVDLVKNSVSYGNGKPDSNAPGSFYKDLDSDILYQRVATGWVVKPIQPAHKIYIR